MWKANGALSPNCRDQTYSPDLAAGIRRPARCFRFLRMQSNVTVFDIVFSAPSPYTFLSIGDRGLEQVWSETVTQSSRSTACDRKKGSRGNLLGRTLAAERRARSRCGICYGPLFAGLKRRHPTGNSLHGLTSRSIMGVSRVRGRDRQLERRRAIISLS